MNNKRADRYRIARNTVLKMLPTGGNGAEIGVWKGDFSARILDAASPARLHLIDPWQIADDAVHANALYGSERGEDMEAVHRSVLDRFADQIAEGRVAIHRATAADALGTLADGSLDFVYVDGDHAYDSVHADLELALTKVRSGGGLIAADDYSTGNWWRDDVIRAVNGFIGDHQAEVAIAFAMAGQVAMVRR